MIVALDRLKVLFDICVGLLYRYEDEAGRSLKWRRRQKTHQETLPFASLLLSP
jgi:hypothetical protein